MEVENRWQMELIEGGRNIIIQLIKITKFKKSDGWWKRANGMLKGVP